MIRSTHELAKCRRAISKWNGIKRVVIRMLQDFELEDHEITGIIDLRLESIQSEIEEYQKVCFNRSSSADVSLDRFSRCPRLFIEARLQLGWSQSELAERVGIMKQQISRYEKSEYKSIRLSKAIEIARVLRDELRSRGFPIPLSES